MDGETGHLHVVSKRGIPWTQIPTPTPNIERPWGTVQVYGTWEELTGFLPNKPRNTQYCRQDFSEARWYMVVHVDLDLWAPKGEGHASEVWSYAPPPPKKKREEKNKIWRKKLMSSFLWVYLSVLVCDKVLQILNLIPVSQPWPTGGSPLHCLIIFRTVFVN